MELLVQERVPDGDEAALVHYNMLLPTVFILFDEEDGG